MKKIMISILISLILAGCSSIPVGYDQATLELKAQEVIDLMESYQVKKVIERLRDDIQAMITSEELLINLEAKYDQVGASHSEIKYTIGDTQDPQTDETYALVIAQVEHENGTSTYTLSFNLDYELVGLYIK